MEQDTANIGTSESCYVTLNGNFVGRYPSKDAANVKARILLRANRGAEVLIYHDKLYYGPKEAKAAS